MSYQPGDVYTFHFDVHFDRGNIVRRRGDDGMWRTHLHNRVQGRALTDDEVTQFLAEFPDQGDCVWRNGTLIAPKVVPA